MTPMTMNQYEVAEKQMLQTVTQRAQQLAAKGLFTGMAQGVRLAHKLPRPVQQQLVARLLQQVLEEAIEDGDLECLEGNWLEVHVTDANSSWYFSLQQDKLQVHTQEPLNFQVVTNSRIAGGSSDLLRMLSRQQDPDTLFFQRRLELSGDTELGLEVRNVLDAVDTDELPAYMQKALQLVSKPLAWQAS